MPQEDTTPTIDNMTVDSESVTDQDLAALDEPTPTSHAISYFGSDFDVEGLVRRLDRGDIVIPSFGKTDESVEVAGFQRNFVWRKAQMDKFIESLLLGFPVPGIVLVQQLDKRYLVLDGQQRLRTLQSFYAGIYKKKEFLLENVGDELRNLTYRTLEASKKRTLDNTFIQAIIVKTDGTPQSLDSVYQVFERLNSGGTQLTGHEIRVALYAGELVRLVANLNSTDSWRALYGPNSPRLRDQELIFRSIALFVAPGNYKRPLKKFLNDFAAANRNCESLNASGVAQNFRKACEILLAASGPDVFKVFGNQVNTAFAEALLVAMMRRCEIKDDTPTSAAFAAAIAELKLDTKFEESVIRATADEESVKYRLGRATAIIGAL